MKEEGKGKGCPLVGRGEQGESEDGVLEEEEEEEDDDDEEVVERRRTMMMRKRKRWWWGWWGRRRTMITIKMKWIRLVRRDTPTT